MMTQALRADAAAPLRRTIDLGGGVDLGLTLGPLGHGPYDPTIRFERGRVWRAMRTPDGPATLLLGARGTRVEAAAWGAGAAWALDVAGELAGAHDDPTAFRPAHAGLTEMARRLPGMRFTRSRRVLDALVPTILEQKVVGLQAQRAWREIVHAWGEPAPGPGRLWLPPAPDAFVSRPYFRYHPFGIERRRADLVRVAASRAYALESLASLSGDEARTRLQSIPGIGPWTAAEVTRVALGDPDAVSLGDYWLPHVVAWGLAGEPRADDARMLELLEPYCGQRARVVRLLEASGVRPPAFGPRMPLRSIAAM